MSALFNRLSAKLKASHDAAPLNLWLDGRVNAIETFTPASVLIGVTEREEPGVILLHRPSNMRAHPGQIAFPGGKRDPGENAVEAALREAHEELGIEPDAVRVIGTSDIYRTGSGYEITPVIGVLPADLKITPNPAEVAQWFEAPVDHVFDPANQEVKEIEFNGATHNFIEIMWNEHRIWGVTGAIVHNLAQRLNWHD